MDLSTNVQQDSFDILLGIDPGAVNLGLFLWVAGRGYSCTLNLKVLSGLEGDLKARWWTKPSEIGRIMQGLDRSPFITSIQSLMNLQNFNALHIAMESIDASSGARFQTNNYLVSALTGYLIGALAPPVHWYAVMPMVAKSNTGVAATGDHSRNKSVAVTSVAIDYPMVSLRTNHEVDAFLVFLAAFVPRLRRVRIAGTRGRGKWGEESLEEYRARVSAFLCRGDSLCL